MSFLKKRRWKSIQFFQPKQELSNEAALRELTLSHKDSVGSSINSSRAYEPSSTSKSGSRGDNVPTKPSLWSHAFISLADTNTSAESKAIANHLLTLSQRALATSPSSDEIPKGLSSEWWLCTEVISLVEAKQSALANESDKPFFRPLQRACSGILQWSQKFMALGDIISQVDPVHVGLPWAGLKAIMIASSQRNDQ